MLTDDYDHDVNDPDFTADRNESDSDDTSNDLSYNDEQVVEPSISKRQPYDKNAR